ncbi:snapalysin family zinc-dependent metalloprotease [Nonomuraea jiangxiensis]|uniref:Extracellular small neutral protease n=1 Tax=Nonomuraea jiangxiensis TaxID=633440 RepID=A0A1G7ZK46_9ACTN|nr:snapalysin family zinc-dependent metalloprotease [Nonomuraea jiangxiensis]SDH08470.1 snapalysin [Nonomuraea jiangxiensis]
MPRPLRLMLSAALCLSFLLVTAPAQAAALVRVLRYDASRAAEFVSAVNQGAAIWNANVVNVRLMQGTPANFVVIADNGWPRAQPRSLGNGTIWMGREASNYNWVRIAAHEMGHILGLPDRRTGLCSDLMSGSSAPVSCANATPNSAERSAVDRNFAGTATPEVEFGRIYENR